MPEFPDVFSEAELTRSYVATRLGIDNTPDAAQLANLSYLAWRVLVPAREVLGCPLVVTDAFRCEELNAADKGVPHSQHVDGLAADFIPAEGALIDAFGRLRGVAGAAVPFDQLILEDDCLHISSSGPSRTPRRQALVRHTKPDGTWAYESVPVFGAAS